MMFHDFLMIAEFAEYLTCYNSTAEPFAADMQKASGGRRREGDAIILAGVKIFSEVEQERWMSRRVSSTRPRISLAEIFLRGIL